VTRLVIFRQTVEEALPQACDAVNGRFDPHELPRRTQDRGVMYAATLPQACPAEFFQTRRRSTIVSRGWSASRSSAQVLWDGKTCCGVYAARS